MCIVDTLIHNVFGIYFENLRLEGGQTGNDTGLISSRHTHTHTHTHTNSRMKRCEWLIESKS